MKGWVVYFIFCLISIATCPHSIAQGIDYDSLVRQGNSQLQAGSNELALASATSAVTANSGRWEAYAVAGGALLNLKRYEEAADQFSHAIDRAPEPKKAGLRALRKQCLLAESGISPTSLPSPTGAPTTQAVLWTTIEHSPNPVDFQVYLQQYPNGPFSPLARQHLEDLQTAQASARRESLRNAVTIISVEHDHDADISEGVRLHIFRNQPGGWDKFSIRIDGVDRFLIENKHDYNLLVTPGKHVISAGDQGFFAPMSKGLDIRSGQEYWLRVSYSSRGLSSHANIQMELLSPDVAAKETRATQDVVIGPLSNGQP
jgi:hypothetical protein